ncbi:MAG: hypothetical protein JWQ33_1376, partial [Ramlibacter sp.]|nr:hypothetical protein [Ramlibacter sp.]
MRLTPKDFNLTSVVRSHVRP